MTRRQRAVLVDQYPLHCELRYDVTHDGRRSDAHECSYWLPLGRELKRDGRWCCEACARVWDEGGPKR